MSIQIDNHNKSFWTKISPTKSTTFICDHTKKTIKLTPDKILYIKKIFKRYLIL